MSSGRTLFISDLHLDEARPAIVERFEAFLRGVAADCDALYILGDLFEAWAGDDGIDLELPARVAAALRGAVARHPVAFMHGNRDFMVAKAFARTTGVAMLADPTVIDLYGQRTALLHGDTLCTDDVAYQAFRAQVRDPAWQAGALARPLAERLAMARQMREGSEGAKQGKTMAIMDVAGDAVDGAFRALDCDVMIHGHTHRPARHDLVVDGRARTRWVLPDWYERGGYLEATASGSRIAEF